MNLSEIVDTLLEIAARHPGEAEVIEKIVIEIEALLKLGDMFRQFKDNPDAAFRHP